MRLLFYRVKILLQIFLYEDLSTLALHTSVGCISSVPADHALCYATNTIKWKTFLIFDINHQQKTEVRPDWNDKNDNANCHRPRITWKVLPAVQVAIFKKIFDQVRKDLDCEFFILFWTKRHNIFHIFTIDTVIFTSC